MRYLRETEADAERRTSQQHIKEENIKRLFDLLHRGRDMSRAELARATGLSPATISALVDELARQELVREVGPAPTARSGRKAINLRLCPDARQIPVFSLNRREICYTLYDLEYQPLETCRVAHATDRYGGFLENAPDAYPDTGADYPAIMEEILYRRARLYDPDRALAVCVSHPGVYLDAEARYTSSAMHISFSRAAMEALEARLDVPLFLGNASTSLAYAEKKRLDALNDPVNDLIYLNVCEGVGAGIVCGGKIFTGADNAAGEIGHISIDYKGPRCVCGNRGCLEQYVNTDAISLAVWRAAGKTAFFSRADDCTLEAIGRASDAGVPEVGAALDDIAAKLFAGVHSAVCMTGIKRIVVGGGIERLGEGFLARCVACAGRDRQYLLTRDVAFTYTKTGAQGDSLGIAQYFVDNAYRITI